MSAGNPAAKRQLPFHGHSRLIVRQFLPMLLSLQGFMIGMIIALCHISGICTVEIDRLKMLVR